MIPIIQQFVENKSNIFTTIHLRGSKNRCNFAARYKENCILTNLNLPDMRNIVTFANVKQLLELYNHQVMIDKTENMTSGLYSEEEVQLLLAERLKRIAKGNAVTVPHEEVKNHIKALLQK